MSLPSSNSTSQAGTSGGSPQFVIPAFDNTLGALLVGGMVAMACVTFSSLCVDSADVDAVSVAYGE